MVSRWARNRCRTRRVAGFTLVELLVVISIIALLISILLPSLSKARDQAKTVVCSTRIKGILLAMATYAAESNDYIAGSPSTTGSALFGPETNNILQLRLAWNIDPVQIWDFEGGMARQFSMNLSTRPFAERFKEIRDMKAFLCPSNKYITDTYRGTQAAWKVPRGRMISYNTSRNYMWPACGALMEASFPDPMGRRPVNPRWNVAGIGFAVCVTNTGDQMAAWTSEKPKPGYVPRLDQIGSPADKVFVADGARFVDIGPDEGPDTNSEPYSKWGGTFADTGPYTDQFTRSWNRIAGYRQGSDIARDPRVFSYRHGKKEGFLPLGNYRMNMGFFDGHVEVMNDISSANPHHWMPKGFKLHSDGIAPDVIEKYFANTEVDHITIR